ncbi:MAG: hypothetical protein ACRD59_08065 [Candidatus Acidiferrales bacterium]
MKRYSSFVGKRVEAHYRVAEIHQTSIGTLVTDTGESVFVEEHFSQGGRNKTMRVEIPYHYVIRIVDAPPVAKAPAPAPASYKKLRR